MAHLKGTQLLECKEKEKHRQKFTDSTSISLLQTLL